MKKLRETTAAGVQSLSTPFINRPVMTVLLTVSAIVFGVLGYRQLAVNDLPQVDYPVIQVSASYPGANPETMANNIATPLEKQFLQIPGLDLITSSSTQGSTSLTLQFDLSKPIGEAATDVQAAIQRSQGLLPIDLPSPPSFTKNNPNDAPIFYLALTSDTLTDGDLYKFATTQVSQRINILPGVSQVDVFGSKAAIRIKANAAALASRGLTLDDLSAAIRAGTTYSGVGQLDGPNRTYQIQPKTQLATADEYRNLIVAQRNNSPVFLRDIAEVVESVQDERGSRSYWARGFRVPASALTLAVSRQAGANAVEVSRAIQALIPQLRAELPGSIQLIPTFDRSLSIVHSVDDVQVTLFIAFVLVVAVIFVFLGRATDTIIPAVALPLSLLITFVAMYALGYSINNLTLLALTLAIGFLVDDAIVFLENVVRRAQGGETILEATYASAREISFTILSMTLSLAAVFIPLVFMPGLLGRIFREFGVTIIVAIFASGVVSLTLTPLMCARMLAERGKGHQETWMERVVGGLFARVVRVYGRTLDWFLDFGWLSAPVLVACIVGLVYFFNVLPKELLPAGDSGFIRGIFRAQEGASPEQMREFQKQVDPVVRANPAVRIALTVTGRGNGAQAFVIVFLKDQKERPPIDEVVGQLQKQLAGIPGIQVFLSPVPALQINTGAGGSNSGEGRYNYTLSGINPEEVYAAADKMQAKLAEFDGWATPPRSDLRQNTPNLDVELLRDRATLYGVSTAEIQGLLRAAYSQNYVYLIKQPSDQYQVILEVEDPQRSHPSDLGLLYVKGRVNADGRQALVPLHAVTAQKPSVGLLAVNHLNQFTSVSFPLNLKPGVPIGAATSFIEKAAAETLPPAVTGKLLGEAEVFATLVRAAPLLLLAALFVMYVILGVLYESYVHPLTVLSTLFPAMVGGLLTLWLFNSTVSLYSFIGLFLLMGIVKKNGIMIVDFALQRLDEGMDRRAAIHEASMERFRPIIMTTLAAFMGAVPLALGYGADGEARRPLGLVIVGGLIVSQLITLYITPAVYLGLEWFQENVLDKVPFLRSVHTHQDAPPAADDAPGAETPLAAAAR